MNSHLRKHSLKTILLASGLAYAATNLSYAQVIQTNLGGFGVAIGPVAIDPLAEAGPHYRALHAGQNLGPGHSGKVIEIASGLNFWDGVKWAPSQAVLQGTTNGFVANSVQHKLRLSHQLNVRGAVGLLTPQGDVLYSTPVGI